MFKCSFHFFLCAFLFSIVATSGYAQGIMETSLFEDARLTYAELNATQQQKYDRYVTNNALVSAGHLVIINDLPTIQNDGRLLVTLPWGFSRYAYVSAKGVKVFEQGFYWYGEVNIDSNGLQGSGNNGGMSGGTPYEEGYFSIRQSNNVYIGHFNFEEENYQVKHLGNGIYVIMVMFHPEEGLSCGNNEGPASDRTQYYNAPQGDGSGRNDISCTVKVLGLFTEKARMEAGGTEEIQAEISLAFDDTRQIFENSRIEPIDVKLEFVGIQFFDFEEEVGVEMQKELDNRLIPALQSSTSELAQLRMTTGADIIVLYTDGGHTDSEGKAGTLDVESDKAISMVEYEFINLRYVTAHEISHLFGCLHQRGEGNSGVFEHPHEFVIGSFLTFNTVRRTIMLVDGVKNRETRRRIPYLSNPHVDYDDVPTGVIDSRHNSRMINATACDVANFVVDNLDPLNAWITAPSRECSCSDLFVEANATGGLQGDYSFQWEFSFDGFNFEPHLSTLNFAHIQMPCSNFHPNASGVHIRLTVTGSSGTVTTQKFIEVTDDTNSDGIECAPFNPIIQNGDISSTFSPLSTSISPNPVTSELEFVFHNEKEDKVWLEIFNIEGLKVYKRQEKVGKGINITTIPTDNLSPGSYFLRVFSEGNIIDNLKFIKI